MDDDDSNNNGSGESISGRSAARYFSQDSSLAQLLLAHGLRIRDFILVSFLSDQGPLTIDQLGRIMSIGPNELLNSVKRLAAAGLVIRDPISTGNVSESMVKLTGRGQDVATRIDEQL